MPNLPSIFPGYVTYADTQFKAANSEYLMQKIGQIANFLADKDFTVGAMITASGTWLKPSSTVKTVVLVGWGGGGAGGHGGASGTVGGAGGGGALVSVHVVDVSAVSSVAVTIGAGGLHVIAGAGNNGGDTLFGSFATFKGGLGGAKGDLPGTIAAVSPALAVPTIASHVYTRLCYYGGVYGTNGTDSDYASGGVTNSGGGGGASFGPGAAGGTNAPGAGATAAANSGAGGGGGGADGLGGENVGGDGGSGGIIPIYLNG